MMPHPPWPSHPTFPFPISQHILSQFHVRHLLFQFPTRFPTALPPQELCHPVPQPPITQPTAAFPSHLRRGPPPTSHPAQAPDHQRFHHCYISDNPIPNLLPALRRGSRPRSKTTQDSIYLLTPDHLRSQGQLQTSKTFGSKHRPLHRSPFSTMTTPPATTKEVAPTGTPKQPHRRRRRPPGLWAPPPPLTSSTEVAQTSSISMALAHCTTPTSASQADDPSTSYSAFFFLPQAALTNAI